VEFISDLVSDFCSTILLFSYGQAALMNICRNKTVQYVIRDLMRSLVRPCNSNPKHITAHVTKSLITRCSCEIYKATALTWQRAHAHQC